MKFNNLEGKMFGKLTVIKRANDDMSGNRQWECECECGKEKIIGGRHLTSGKTVSCGCYRISKTEVLTLTHGKSNTRLYKIWSGMKHRCKNHKDYKHLSFYENWEDFEVFYEWAVQSGYTDKLTIDRIDNDKGYNPSNCRWATHKQQADNRRTTKFIEYKGETMSIAKHCDKEGVNRNTVYTRLSRGWSFEEAIAGRH